MKVTVDPRVLGRGPGLCVGIVAIRSMDNRAGNREAEAFRRRCCTKTNLLLRLDPSMADRDIEAYKKAMHDMGCTGDEGALSRVFNEYVDHLVDAAGKQEGKRGSATMNELAGSDVLPPLNPLMDMIRAAMLKFHVDIHGYDVESRKAELSVALDREDVVTTCRGEVFCKDWIGNEMSGAITEDTENCLVLIYGTRGNRKKVAAARNELGRRMKSAFECAVESGWIEGSQTEFVTDI
ncbi:MAG: hypothetical protein SPI25_00415 [Dialister sp.]|nr:hypothetical protein [Dialister sp.]